MSATLTQRLLTTRYKGMFQILLYNWPHYLWSSLTGIAGVAAVIALPLPVEVKAAAIVAIGIGFGWLTCSLWASHHIYDASKLYEFRWVKQLLSPRPKRWVNIHAGLDETSLKLLDIFPTESATVLDIYDPITMSEPSIRRARRLTPSKVPAIKSDFRNLPVGNRAADTVFVIFAAHEIRDPIQRIHFFMELNRILEPGGKLLLVEHLRDFANFAAFGPGFFHFLPLAEWLRLGRETGFVVFKQIKITPFVRVFVLGKLP